MESIKQVVVKPKIIKEIIKLISPIQKILAITSFKTLTPLEKQYAFCLQNATKIGLLVSFFHRSYESPALFTLFMKIFGQKKVTEIRKELKGKFNKEEIDKIFFYFGGVVSNAGNYLCWGGKKFVPDLPKSRFLDFLRIRSIFKYSGLQKTIWNKISHELFAYEPPYGEIGLSSAGLGLSPYYSVNLKKDEILKIDKRI